MELKVWVEGIQRIVCGVSETTTCQEVVYALAHATGRTGRFTLTERWRNNERLLAPHEHPLKVLLKWGEYSNDVQFILQHNVSNSNTATFLHTSPTAVSNSSNWPVDHNKDVRKSLPFSPHHRTENVGIVKGVPKQVFSVVDIKPENQSLTKVAGDNKVSVSGSACAEASLKYREDEVQRPATFSSSQGTTNTSKSKTPPSYRDPPDPGIPYIRVLPPYREPPPPCSNSSKITCRAVSSSDTNTPLVRYSKEGFQNESDYKSSFARVPEYRDLIYLINQQREKLFAQQAELSKYDAEIMYWETKTKEQQYQMEMLSQDAVRVDSTLKQVDEQLKSMGSVEEEMEIVKQQDRTLKSELTLLRSKLANCETELLLCKKKIRLLLDEIKIEQRILAKESDERNHIERLTIVEVDRLQTEVEQAKHEAEVAAKIGDSLNKEVAILEAAINEKKRQVEKLVTDMKEANLQSLATSAPEELKNILEGAPFFKTGSTRKMIGSPRQLENAVPTSKNPHGIWV